MASTDGASRGYGASPNTAAFTLQVSKDGSDESDIDLFWESPDSNPPEAQVEATASTTSIYKLEPETDTLQTALSPTQDVVRFSGRLLVVSTGSDFEERDGWATVSGYLRCPT